MGANSIHSTKPIMTDTILVVDDEASLLEALAGVLEHYDYVVLKASDGVEAMKLIQENRVDLLITDYMMPKLDGIALYHRVMAECTSAMPIIMMSALPDALEKLVPYAVLKKPFLLEEFIHHVEGALKARLDSNSDEQD
jgi:two-component system response regulator VanR